MSLDTLNRAWQAEIILAKAVDLLNRCETQLYDSATRASMIRQFMVDHSSYIQTLPGLVLEAPRVLRSEPGGYDAPVPMKKKS